MGATLMLSSAAQPTSACSLHVWHHLKRGINRLSNNEKFISKKHRDNKEIVYQKKNLFVFCLYIHIMLQCVFIKSYPKFSDLCGQYLATVRTPPPPICDVILLIIDAKVNNSARQELKREKRVLVLNSLFRE